MELRDPGCCPDRYITGDIGHVVVNAAVRTEPVHAVRQHQRYRFRSKEQRRRPLETGGDCTPLHGSTSAINARDCEELVRGEARAADQRTVDIGSAQQLLGIRGLPGPLVGGRGRSSAISRSIS